MSDRIVLTLRAPLTRTLDASSLTPDRLAAQTAGSIGAITLRSGGAAVPLGDVFRIEGERSTQVVLEGDLERADGIGTAMQAGSLLVLGSAGRDLGMGLAGGSIEVRGAAGANVGGARHGAARGMTGGEIVVRNGAGEGAGARMRRGILVVMGDVGSGAGRGMVAGTVVLGGQSGPGVGRFVKRGSIVSLEPVEPERLYRYACTYRPPFVRLLFQYLNNRYGLSFTEAQIGGRYRRYCGDLSELGRGEILAWTEQ